MNYSPVCVALVKKFEGCSLKAYPDASGHSIGYGHFGATEGEEITQEQADAYLVSDLEVAANAVNKFVTRTLTQGQFDALCDFVYNLGVQTFHNSKVLFYVNQGMDAWTKEHMMLYVYSGGKILQALVERRTAEVELYGAR